MALEYLIDLPVPMENGAQLGGQEKGSDLNPNPGKREKLMKVLLAVTADARQRMSRGEAPQENETILIPKAEGGTIHLRTRANLAVIVTAQRAPEIQMNGNQEIGSQAMKKETSETEIVSFPLDDGSYENLHARALGNYTYLLDNSPFYAYDVSYLDEVKVEFIDGRNVFQSVSKRGGHSTYRVKLAIGRTHQDFAASFESLKDIGCTFEGAGVQKRRLYAIDLSPSVDVMEVYRILEDGEDRGLWEFEEAHFFKGHSK